MKFTEKRAQPSNRNHTDHRAEFKFPGVPVYQFKVRDVCASGAGVVVKADSDFLKMIEVGQELNVRLLYPVHSMPSGHFKSRVAHVSELAKSRFKGHLAVGISILEKVPFHGY